MMSKWLPSEVIADILSRLPVKSLMRFRCFSKAWCSLISSPDFISTHLNRSLSNSHQPPYLFISHNFPDFIHTLLLYPSDQEKEEKGDFFAYPSDCIDLRGVPKSKLDLLQLVGSSNGVLCLTNMAFNKKTGICLLWNPSIQKAISLPKPKIRSSFHSVGFGYEPMTDDYKLVRLVYSRRNYPPLVEIYTLRTGRWRSGTAPGTPYLMNWWYLSVFMNGAVHWPATVSQCQGGFRNVIVSFNMKDEAFGEVALPKSLQGLDHLSFSVALRDGLLAIVPRNELGNEAFQAVWVMKEYGVAESWTKLFDVRIRRSENVLGFTKSGEVLVQKGGGLLSLGPSSRGYVDLHIYDTREIFLDTYVESLVLLRQDRVPGRQGSSSSGT